ncbi:hypothetical protein SASPL_155764 [Salvia splendens]|uniref:Uncharacterized protein n=1 Tax=Salvia splendens TaxID=180675 RepID=A0A8X8VXT2_SALSN|nr:hypothetical protein SASPL_155764 [Salvia splendens]
MSSTGASYAHLYVQQKKAQKDRTKRMEEDGVSNDVDEGKSNVVGLKSWFRVSYRFMFYDLFFVSVEGHVIHHIGGASVDGHRLTPLLHQRHQSQYHNHHRILLADSPSNSSDYCGSKGKTSLMSVEEALALKDSSGETALHNAAIVGNTVVATALVDRNSNLLHIVNDYGDLSVVIAAANL